MPKPHQTLTTTIYDLFDEVARRLDAANELLDYDQLQRLQTSIQDAMNGSRPLGMCTFRVDRNGAVLSQEGESAGLHFDDPDDLVRFAKENGVSLASGASISDQNEIATKRWSLACGQLQSIHVK